jgi:23S rRNA (cytidine1920-2'-O)/16S rRNA (cytidine1409-2'-O)-methyltransferase
MKIQKERLDKLMVARGLAENSSKAQALIIAGNVFSEQQRLNKPGLLIHLEAEITLKEIMPYVSRGGLKLAAALDEFKLDVTGFSCLDIGASTGGFTDCLLQRGAKNIVALDVGHGQFAWKLRQDPRIEVREHVNARFLQPQDFQEKFDLAVCDVSFISLKLILPVIPALLKNPASVVTLIKPQFEVAREEVGIGGIIRDEVLQRRVVEEIKDCAKSQGFNLRGVIDSPIFGQDGNREFLACFSL